MSAGHLSLCLVCLSPPSAAVSVTEPVSGSGRPLGDVISDLVPATDRHMLQSVCHQCHRLLADFDEASERARALRSTIQSVFDRADRHLVAMLLEPRQSKAVLAAAARYRQTAGEEGTGSQAVHIEILQAADGKEKPAPMVVTAPPPPEPEPASMPLDTAPAIQELNTPSVITAADTGIPSIDELAMAAPPITTINSASPVSKASTTITTNITISATNLANSGNSITDTTDVISTAKNNSDNTTSASTANASIACRYRCGLCGEGFRDKSLLTTHRRKSHGSRARGGGSRTLECSVCRQRFTSRAALKQHERSHAPDSRLDCATCGKTFRCAATLQAHQRLHDERGFCCPYCPQKYISRQDLEEHVSSHTGARNCACPECGKTYKFRSNLAHHIETVHRKKELACAVCGKTFNMMKKLRRHRNIVHGRLRYKCTECDSRFCYEGQLRRHMKKAKHVNGGKGDASVEAYIETVETDADGTQMLTLVIDDGTSGTAGEDDAGETLVLSVGENFDSNLMDAAVERAAVGGGEDGAILEIIGDGDLAADSTNQIILRS